MVENNQVHIGEEAHGIAHRIEDETGLSLSPLIMDGKTFERNLRNGSTLENRIREDSVTLRGEPPWE
jgi:hypothetical protein